MTDPSRSWVDGGPVVVGVVPHQPPEVLAEAAALAATLRAELVPAYVDRSRYVVQEHPDGSVRSSPIDPDPDDPADATDGAAILDPLRERLDTAGVHWSFRYLAGEPSRALAHLAQVLGARVIVVGTREHGLRPRLEGFFTGSVAVQLAHRQTVPVLVVPTTAGAREGRVPWE
jgi:nucleotide-binding universal stress UspA family protein